MPEPVPVLVTPQPVHVLRGRAGKKKLIRTKPGGARAEWRVPGVPGMHRTRAAAVRAAALLREVA